MSDMELEQYQNQINDLLQAVETLLKSNKAMGEKALDGYVNGSLGNES